MFFFDSESDTNQFDKKSQIKRFRRNANRLIEYVCDFTEKETRKPVSPDVEPGFLKALIGGKLICNAVAKGNEVFSVIYIYSRGPQRARTF